MMKSRQVVFFYVAMMMVLLAGCETPGQDVKLTSGRTISISKKSIIGGQEVSVPFDNVPPSDDTPRNEVKYKKRWITVTENGDSFRLQFGLGRRIIDISPAPKPPFLVPTPIFIQPLTHMMWEESRINDQNIKEMQLYISGTVVLEYEEHSRGLTARQNSNPVPETLKGTDLTGPVSANESITQSTYINILYVLETMTPGVAIKFDSVSGRNILEVSFDPGPNGTQQVLRFAQSLSAPLGYFFLDYPNNSIICYGDKNYEIRFDEKNKMPPYLMIRTELPPFVQNSNSLLGRRQ
ncbi:hypothetical protein AGMMS50255_2140 [Spirochaetia bacterium]|nr:hypothetical protein AGMMS50255_2140 [Spirochaetia bacterium]